MVVFPRCFIASAFVACLAFGSTTQAQDYPRKTVQIVVGNAPGITTDSLSRLVASKLTERLGWTVIIDNRPGANSSLAVRQVLQAPADGYSILTVVSSMALAPSTTKNLPYDFLRDFEPISRMARTRLVLVTSATSPLTDMQSLIRYAKANPGKLSYASANSGSVTHLAGELLKQVAGFDMLNIPYNNSTFNTDVAAGNVPLGVNTVSTTAPLVISGKLRALAILSNEREAALPNVPSSTDLGMPDVVADAWYGLAVRVGTPRDITARLSREVMTILELPEVKAKILAMGASPISETPDAFRKLFEDDLKRWDTVVRRSNLKFD